MYWHRCTWHNNVVHYIDHNTGTKSTFTVDVWKHHHVCLFGFLLWNLQSSAGLISVMSATSCSVICWQDFLRSCWQQLILLMTVVWENLPTNINPLCFFEYLGRSSSTKINDPPHHVSTFFAALLRLKPQSCTPQCAPTFHVPGPWAWWRDHRGDSWKSQHTACHRLLWLIWSLVCLSLPYLWAQACSTSATVFGASDDRIRGPPLSWITTSSSILTPRPRKRSGAWSLSSLMYNPETKGEK